MLFQSAESSFVSVKNPGPVKIDAIPSIPINIFPNPSISLSSLYMYVAIS